MTSNPTTFQVRSDDDLGALWRQVVGPGGFEQYSLWMVFLDEHNKTLPLIVPLDDVPDRPDEQLLGNLEYILENVLATTPAVATSFLLSRPGPENMTDFDRQWARALLDRFAPPTRFGPIHVATKARLRVVAADDLVAVGKTA